MMKLAIFTGFLLLAAGCITAKKDMVVDTTSIDAGTKVTAGGKPVDLYKGTAPLKVGSSAVGFLKEIGADAAIAGKVAVINIVPSIDTPVCEEQSHILGETKDLAADVVRLSISRDLPMANQRFAREAKLENIAYFSDYKTGGFGKNTGLLMKGNELLARAVLVTDRKGIIRYLQIVPDVSHLPDMAKAFQVANDLAK